MAAASSPRMTRRSQLATIVGATALVSTFVSGAQAQEAPAPRIMQEPGEVTDVIDAFDDDNGDPFDFSLRLDFQYLAKQARIVRETAAFAPGLTTGGFTSKLLNVANYRENTSRLAPRADFGIYKDLALYFRVPIILSNTRKLEAIDNGPSSLATLGAPGEQLFTLPFEAPARSGVEHLAIGLDYSIFNQARDRTKPTWVFGVETRIALGEPMHACSKGRDPQCTHPGDVNQNGRYDSDVQGADGTELESVQSDDARSPGVTRGTVGLELHSYMSKRIKYVEPYGGFRALFEFAMGNSDFGATNLEGALVNHPPLVGTVFVGMMVHPWEDRESYNRLTLDAGFQGEYHSEGRDYSELFDVIGSSAAPSLRNPNWSRFSGAGCVDGVASCVDQTSEKVYNTGLTVVEPFGSYRVHGSITWRAHKFVKFSTGLGLRFDQAHGITHDQPCNPDFRDDIGAGGPCNADLGGGTVQANGIPNPAYRRTINSVGRRFYVDKSITYEVFAAGTVMF